MKLKSTLCLLLGFLAAPAMADGPDATGAREHSAGSVAATYFIVDKMARTCVKRKARDQAWQESVTRPWLDKHKSYLLATRGFLAHRLREVQAQEGADARNEYEANVRQAMPGIVDDVLRKLFKDTTDTAACQNFESAMANGDWDLAHFSKLMAEANTPVDFEDLRAAGAPYIDGDTDNLSPLPFAVSL